MNYVIYGISFLFPRSKNKWVFGNYIVNAFSDNPKYLFIYVNEHYPEIRPIWIGKNEKVYNYVKNLGFEVYRKNSFKGFFHCLTAGTYFFNAYVHDINYFTSGGAVLVNLWHGVGLKTIEFNIERGILAPRYYEKKLFFRLFMPWIYKRPSYLVSSTDFQSRPFAKAFRIPLSQCLNIGYPRNEILIADESERRRFIEKYEPKESVAFLESLEKYNRVFIYMPTWRDSSDFIDQTGIDFHALNAILAERGDYLILKFHINTAGLKLVQSLSNITVIPGNIDVYTVLPHTDILITDYSSVLYDYILMPDKQVILYLFDYEGYVNDRDFNYPFLPNIAGTVVKEASELYAVFRGDKGLESENDMDFIRQKFWGNFPGNASQKLITLLLHREEPEPAVSATD